MRIAVLQGWAKPSLVWSLMLAAALAAALPAGSHAAEAEEAETENASPDPALAPGFLVQLSSSQDAKLNGTYRIQKDGKIDLPYNVVVQTQGMNLTRFRNELTKAYKPYFKSTPSIQATVKQKRYWVEIRGLVETPGNYLVKRESPMDEIISVAGGLSEDLERGYARIEQGERTVVIDLGEYFRLGMAKNMPTWKGGERIFFQKERPAGAVVSNDESSQGIQILGEVRNPGQYTYRSGADIYYYLVKTGGPQQSTDLSRVEQVRVNKKTGQREQIHLGSMDGIQTLEEGDILIFHPQRQSGFERFLGTTAQVTSIIAAVVSTAILAFVATRTTK